MSKLSPVQHWLTEAPRLWWLKPALAMTLDDLAWLDSKGIERRVKAGFVTDGTSTGILKRWLKPWNPLTLRDGILHDAGYSLHGTPFDMGSRRECDARLYETLSAGNWPLARAYQVAVRALGWYPWRAVNNEFTDHYITALTLGVTDKWVEQMKIAFPQGGKNETPNTAI